MQHFFIFSNNSLAYTYGLVNACLRPFLIIPWFQRDFGKANQRYYLIIFLLVHWNESYYVLGLTLTAVEEKYAFYKKHSIIE
jgi:hypothetical protein